MAKLAIILSIAVLLAFCNSKEYTIKELREAKWDTLSRGIYFISVDEEKGIAAKTDSINFKILDVPNKEVKPTDLPAGVASYFSTSLELESLLGDSKHGYLKIDFDEWLRTQISHGKIYLRYSYNPPHTFASDSSKLINISGIKSAEFISKEEAKKIYLAHGNTDWEGVLDVNPLPDAIEIKLEVREWTKATLDNLKNSILDELGAIVSDVSFPAALFEKSEGYYLLEYRRITHNNDK